MTIPRSGQTVHMLSRGGVLRVIWKLRGTEGRNVAELALYTTDDLRRLYQTTEGDIIQLRDGIVSRVQLVAVIRWRLFWDRWSYRVLLVVSVASAVFALFAWRDPVPAPASPTIPAPAPPPVAAPMHPAPAGK